MHFTKINEGISYDGNKFNVSFFHNESSDIVCVAISFIHQSRFDGKTYFFGYEFNKDVSLTMRTKFLPWIKGLDKDNMPNEFTIETMVSIPIDALNRAINLGSIDCVLTPRSNRSDLTKIIHGCVLQQLPRTNIKSFELVKSLPAEVEFDRDKFEDDHAETDSHSYKQLVTYIETVLLPKIH